MRIVIFFLKLIIGCLLILNLSCKKESANTKVIVQEVTFTKEGDLQIMKPDSTLVVQLEIEIADNDYEIQTGLMYRKKMQENRGMLFIFPNEEPRYFYMKNTEIALDLLYIDANYKIVSIMKNTQPFDENTLPASAPAKYVLEVNAGFTDKKKISKGDLVKFTKD
ncbi:DUF192 domain-containing protein [Ascidiimonas sp. W6]|uniref:DUF192 domain-containing protein n=1 Tax=Ascidiimonas meishanensis TaxID=3128903 RepID=UPI0030EB8F06